MDKLKWLSISAIVLVVCTIVAPVERDSFLSVAVDYLLAATVALWSYYQYKLQAVPKKADSFPGVAKAVNELSETLAFEAVIINQEVDRVEGLVREAVAALGENFMEISALCQQYEEAYAIGSNHSGSSNPVDSSTPSLLSIQARLNMAAQSLQFEDLASQALNSIHHNINTINQIAELVPELVCESGYVNESVAAQLHNLCIELRLEAEERNSARTVSQNDLDEGKIELF